MKRKMSSGGIGGIAEQTYINDLKKWMRDVEIEKKLLARAFSRAFNLGKDDKDQSLLLLDDTTVLKKDLLASLETSHNGTLLMKHPNLKRVYHRIGCLQNPFEEFTQSKDDLQYARFIVKSHELDKLKWSKVQQIYSASVPVPLKENKLAPSESNWCIRHIKSRAAHLGKIRVRRKFAAGIRKFVSACCNHAISNILLKIEKERELRRVSVLTDLEPSEGLSSVVSTKPSVIKKAKKKVRAIHFEPPSELVALRYQLLLPDFKAVNPITLKEVAKTKNLELMPEDSLTFKLNQIMLGVKKKRKVRPADAFIALVEASGDAQKAINILGNASARKYISKAIDSNNLSHWQAMDNWTKSKLRKEFLRLNLR